MSEDIYEKAFQIQSDIKQLSKMKKEKKPSSPRSSKRSLIKMFSLSDMNCGRRSPQVGL